MRLLVCSDRTYWHMSEFTRGNREEWCFDAVSIDVGDCRKGY
jgi:hypothetical protein